MIIQIEPWIDAGELAELQKVVKSTFVVEHELAAEFEGMTREMTGAKHAIAMCNGTMALYVCLKAMGIGEGDEVIVPNITFVATANAVILAGAKPVFCEVTEDTFCIDMGFADNLITRKTKAIIPVHLYGQSADLDLIMPFAKKYRLAVIEDAAQGVGVKFNNKHVGTFGDMGILSYYGNKTITTGEGGVVLTNNDELAKLAYRLKNHGRDEKGTFIHEHIGFNFSFTEMQAAVGVSQMKKLPKIIEKKNHINEVYLNELSDISGIDAVSIDERCEPVFWFTSFLADDADKLAAYLKEKGIQTRRFFYPLHMQPCYQEKFSSNKNFKISEDIYRRGISLPSSYCLTDKEQKCVIEAVKGFYYENRD